MYTPTYTPLPLYIYVYTCQDDKTLLKAYRLEIEQLKQKLQQLETQSTISHVQSSHSNSMSDIYGKFNSHIQVPVFNLLV